MFSQLHAPQMIVAYRRGFARIQGLVLLPVFTHKKGAQLNTGLQGWDRDYYYTPQKYPVQPVLGIKRQMMSIFFDCRCNEAGMACDLAMDAVQETE
jgi:hypothetical protein